MTAESASQADLDAVTAVGAEDHSEIDPAAIERIWQAARHWYAAGMHPAIQLCLRHNGKVVLNRAIGHGWGNAPDDPPDADKVPVSTETPFCAFSAAKAIATTVVHMLVERGFLSLDDRVCEYLPTYTSHGKDRTTIRHVITHSAGVPFATGPRPDVNRMDDAEYARRKLGELKPIHRPGLVHIYHGVTWGFLVREIVSAATGKNIREILATEILDPLGFRWTNFGVAEHDVPLVAPSYNTGKPLPAPIARAFKIAVGGTMAEIIPFSNTPLFLTGVAPSSNLVSTADEMSRLPPKFCCAAVNSTAWCHAAGDPARGDDRMPSVTPGYRGRACTAPLGHRVHARVEAVRAVRAQCACGIRQYRSDQHRGLGRPGARPCGRTDQQRQARQAPRSQPLSRGTGSHHRRDSPGGQDSADLLAVGPSAVAHASGRSWRPPERLVGPCVGWPSWPVLRSSTHRWCRHPGRKTG